MKDSKRGITKKKAASGKGKDAGKKITVEVGKHSSSYRKEAPHSFIKRPAVTLQSPQVKKKKTVIVRVDENMDVAVIEVKSDKKRELCEVFGYSILGACIPGLISSIMSFNVMPMVLSAALGIVGLVLVVVGLHHSSIFGGESLSIKNKKNPRSKL